MILLTGARIPGQVGGRFVSSASDDVLSESEVFDLLSSSRRRHVLRRLGRDGESVTLQRLTDEIAARENDKSVDEVTDRERKRTYVSLHQTHVPAMVDAGIVEYESESGRIVPRAEVTQVLSYLTPGERPSPGPSPAWYVRRGQRDVVWLTATVGLVVVGIAVLAGVVSRRRRSTRS